MSATEPTSELAKPVTLTNGLDAHRMFDGGQNVFASWVQATSELAAEMGDFTRARMQADCETVTALMSCRDPATVFQCQCQAAEKALKAYLDEVGKLSRLAMDRVLSSQPALQSRGPKG
jgi:hypothetical protein